MLTANSGINLITGYQNQLAVKNDGAASSQNSQSNTTEPSSGQNDPKDSVVISQKARALQNDYQKKENGLEQSFNSETQKLEREYQQAKQDLESEYRQKKRSLDINIYV